MRKEKGRKQNRKRKKLKETASKRRAERILGPVSTRPHPGVLVTQNKALQKEPCGCKKWPSSFKEADILLSNEPSSYLGS